MFTVVSLNINYYVDKHGPWEQRRGLICEALELANADFVALQAVRQDPARESGLDQAQQFSRMLPVYRYVFFAPAETFPDGSVHGSAILSQHPFASQDSLPLSLQPGLEDANRRLLLHAAFELPHMVLHLFNAHFSWVPEQARENLKQAIPYIGRVTGPALLVGDFNTPAGSGLLDPLMQAGWTDAWARLHPDDPGATFEAPKTKLRIDYAWVNPALSSKLKGIELILGDTGKIRMSDHLGLKVQFE